MSYGLVHISRFINGLTKNYSSDYLEYLNSPEWQYKRAKVIQRARGYCERCHKNAAREVHHLTYARLGDEDMADLMALCRPCHVEMDRERK